MQYLAVLAHVTKYLAIELQQSFEFFSSSVKSKSSVMRHVFKVAITFAGRKYQLGAVLIAYFGGLKIVRLFNECPLKELPIKQGRRQDFL